MIFQKFQQMTTTVGVQRSLPGIVSPVLFRIQELFLSQGLKADRTEIGKRIRETL